MEEPRWTLDELAERVDAALAVDYHGQSSGRVRDVPDRRAIRWYTTIGLIDRPVAHRGRTALYGPRHLLQLVAVKRLQAAGLPLVAIQQELAGATGTQLARVARLPAAAATPFTAATPFAAADGGPSSNRVPARPPASAVARRAPAGPARRAAFWREQPAATVTAAVTAEAPDAVPADPAGATGAGGTEQPSANAAPTRTDASHPASPAAGVRPDPVAIGGVASLRGVRLGDGATLLLEPGRELDAADLQAILDAARPLVATLRVRRLGGPPDPASSAVDPDLGLDPGPASSAADENLGGRGDGDDRREHR